MLAAGFKPGLMGDLFRWNILVNSENIQTFLCGYLYTPCNFKSAKYYGLFGEQRKPKRTYVRDHLQHQE